MSPLDGSGEEISYELPAEVELGLGCGDEVLIAKLLYLDLLFAPPIFKKAAQPGVGDAHL